MTAPTLIDPRIDAIKAAVRAQKLAEDNLRRERPLVRFFDAEWRLQHVGGAEVRAQHSWVSNDTGPAQYEIPLDAPVAQWIHDHQGRLERGEGRSIGLTVDYCGARWSGTLDKYTVEQREDGDVVLVADFLHDYEHLKWISCWANPWMSSAFQAPRAWCLAGPVDWALKTTLLVNLAREHAPLLTWPDDPLDGDQWFNWLDMRQWHMAVRPGSFIESMASGITWGVVISRFATWHDMAHTMLEDAELSVRCDRYLDGDPEPWPGYRPRNGQLIVDIVDKSGIYVGTSHGGDLLDGLRRTVFEFADDFIDSTESLAQDVDVPQDYFAPGYKYTAKELPYVVFREGETSPVQTSQWINSPAKGVQVVCGGHSAPGVNETISATVQAVGDLIGNVAMIGSLGGSLDSLLKPLYEDTVLAWMAVKSPQRATNSGWERFFEYFCQGNNNQAFTVSALLVLRAGFWATKTTISWKAAVADGLPWLVGDRGKGHFFLDDRVGLVLKGDTKIHMDRCRKLDLAWDADTPPEWQINVGDDRNLMDPATRALGKIETLISGLRELGVW